MCLKTEHLSIQSGIHKYSEQGKASAMKEMKNLVEKNDCFKEVDFNSLSDEMKSKAMPLLMLMISKRNRVFKSRGVAYGGCQKICIDKDDCSSPAPDFYAFKYVRARIAYEDRDAATLDLSGFFLQADTDEEDEPMLLKLTGAVALLLVKSDPDKWKKHLR